MLHLRQLHSRHSRLQEGLPGARWAARKIHFAHAHEPLERPSSPIAQPEVPRQTSLTPMVSLTLRGPPRRWRVFEPGRYSSSGQSSSPSGAVTLEMWIADWRRGYLISWQLLHWYRSVTGLRRHLVIAGPPPCRRESHPERKYQTPLTPSHPSRVPERCNVEFRPSRRTECPLPLDQNP